MTMLRLSLGGGQSLRQGSALLHRLQSGHYAPSSTAAHHFAVRRSFADDAKTDPPKGTPYSKLTVGVPKETFPLEKRVAATPDVSLWMFLAFVLQLSLRNTNTSLSCRHVRIYLFIYLHAADAGSCHAIGIFCVPVYLTHLHVLPSLFESPHM